MLSKILTRIQETGVTNVEMLSQELHLNIETIRGMLRQLIDLGYLENIPPKRTTCSPSIPTSPLCFGCTGCSTLENPTENASVAYRLRKSAD